MELNELTVENVTPVITQIVEEYGSDYVYRDHYSTCEYQVNGEPACLVGHVLDRIGVEYDPAWEGHPFVDLWLGDDYHVVNALQSAQDAQDSWQNWGDALKEYKNYVNAYTSVLV